MNSPTSPAAQPQVQPAVMPQQPVMQPQPVQYVAPQQVMQPAPVAAPARQTPWMLIALVALLIAVVMQAPAIIVAMRGGDSPSPTPTPAPSTAAIFASTADAQYFGSAAKGVAKILKADGEAKPARFTKNEQVSEDLAGSLARSVLLGGLRGKVDRKELAEFMDSRFDADFPYDAGPLTAESRAKAVGVYEKMAADALEAVK